MKFLLLKLAALASVSSSGVYSHSLRTNYNRIHCRWTGKIGRTRSTRSHTRACLNLEDEHVVPYECDSDESKYHHICCTRSNIDTPTFDTYGECFKVDAYDYEDDYDDDYGHHHHHHHDYDD